MTGPRVAAEPPPHADGDALAAAVSPPDRLGDVRLPDGRLLGWSSWGPAAGRTVLLCPGAGTSRRLGFVPSAVLHDLGLRLVSVDRPGLGASDPDPHRTLADWPVDVGALRDGLGLDLVAVVGFSQGAPFALAVAAAGLVRAAACVSGTDELARPAVRDLLVPEVAAMVDAAVADPAAAERRLAGTGAEGLLRLVHELAPGPDRAVYGTPPVADALRAAVGEGLARGAAGYARDTVLASTPWPFAPEDIRVPVDLWYGALDTSPVHSPDLGASLAGRLPGARRHVVPDAGGALLWTHASEITTALTRLLQEDLP